MVPHRPFVFTRVPFKDAVSQIQYLVKNRINLLILGNGFELREFRRHPCRQRRAEGLVIHRHHAMARFHRLEDAGQEADADAVAQLGMGEAQVANLVEHRAAVLVTMRIPAGRE